VLYLTEFNSFFQNRMPQEISDKEYSDFSATENTPIPAYLFQEIVRIGGTLKYLPTIKGGRIQMFGVLPNKKFLIVKLFEPKDDAPYYLIRFTTDAFISEELQRKGGLIRYYMAEDFEEVKNFCRENL